MVYTEIQLAVIITNICPICLILWCIQVIKDKAGLSLHRVDLWEEMDEFIQI